MGNVFSIKFNRTYILSLLVILIYFLFSFLCIFYFLLFVREENCRLAYRSCGGGITVLSLGQLMSGAEDVYGWPTALTPVVTVLMSYPKLETQQAKAFNSTVSSGVDSPCWLPSHIEWCTLLPPLISSHPPKHFSPLPPCPASWLMTHNDLVQQRCV